MCTRSIYCCNCNDEMKCDLKTGLDVYPSRKDLEHLFFWKCSNCGSFVGCHKGGKGKKPLGIIPSPEIKNARQHIHKILDPLWKNGRAKRGDLYRLLSDVLGREYHTADLRTIDECRKIYKHIKSLYITLPEHIFPIISNHKDYIGQKVHVVGWDKGCVFYLKEYEDGVATLRTPKLNKTYKTKNKLTHLAS